MCARHRADARAGGWGPGLDRGRGVSRCSSAVHLGGPMHHRMLADTFARHVLLCSIVVECAARLAVLGCAVGACTRVSRLGSVTPGVCIWARVGRYDLAALGEKALASRGVGSLIRWPESAAAAPSQRSALRSMGLCAPRYGHRTGSGAAWRRRSRRWGVDFRAGQGARSRTLAPQPS